MKKLLIEQNIHWDGKRYNSVKREALEKLISFLPLRQIITITGIRRCGKSTLAKQAINYLIDSGVEAKNILFVNLENPLFLEYRDNPSYLDTIFEEYLKLMNPKGKIYCIFDEIQFFNNWQVYIKSKYESSDIKFIITGSNSSLLSNELNTLLSGRSLNIHLNTFSFLEFLNYKKIEYHTEFDRIKNRIEIARAKDEYLKWGGFYEVFDTNDNIAKKEILISYAKNIIYQDIVPRFNIRNSQTLEKLFYYLLMQVTGILNYSTIAKTFVISDKSVKEYIGYFEDVFLFKRVDRFHYKPKERIKSSKKIYTLDNGFLQIVNLDNINFGILLENMVFNVLNRNCDNITYLRDKKEIDFKCQNSLIQVAYDISDIKTKKRELEAFEYFDKDRKNRHYLITYNQSDEIDGVFVKSFEDFVFSGVMNEE